MIPHDFPPWPTVYDHYRRENKRGVWQEVLDSLNARNRLKQGKRPSPSYAIVDSQSVKSQYACKERGIDGGKKIKGRKRHISVDTLGNLLHVKVHAANQSDTKEGCAVFEQSALKYPSLRAFSADAGYCGTSVEFVEKVLGLKLDIAKGIKGQWILMKKRWIVERTFAWFGGVRRLAKDYEILTNTAENMIRIAMIKVTLAKCLI